jgi:hypothetical protein
MKAPGEALSGIDTSICGQTKKSVRKSQREKRKIGRSEKGKRRLMR